MKLKFGIDKLTPGWKTILQQQAYNYSEIDFEQDLNDHVCLIITSAQSLHFKEEIVNYITNGGFVLTNSDFSRLFLNITSKKKKVKSLIPEEQSKFHDLGLIDFFTDFNYLDPTKVNWLDKKLMLQTKKIGSGMLINIPFDLDEMILDQRSKRKKFWADRKELPSEIVSRISKGKIRQLIHKLLVFIHQKRDLQLIRISEFPKSMTSLFLFRVDTDFCTADQASELHELCKKYNIQGTWFVDTKDPSTLKKVYAKMADQEIGLRCRRHLIFDDYESNRMNITNGLEDLAEAGIKVKGFAAPFGSWNENLGRFLEEKKFIYSSEFALNYDDLPFYPFFQNKFSSVLQIPIFPVSTGRLRRSHFSLDEMWEFYKNYIDDRIKKGQPVLIYYHPSHGHLQVVEKVFSYISKFGIPNLTFAELAEFWNERKDFFWQAEQRTDIIKMKFDETSKMQIVFENENELTYSDIKSKIDLQKLTWHQRKNINIPKDLERIRKWHWRDALYNYESNKGKKYHENLSG